MNNLVKDPEIRKTVNSINKESLFIIQKTPYQKPSNHHYYQTQIAFEHQVMGLLFDLKPQIITCNNVNKKITDFLGRPLQTPVATSKEIQLPMWKKQKFKSFLHPSYHYMSKSTINISLANASTSNMISAFGQLPFQSKQKKTELLGTYDFGIANLWEITASEKEEKEE
ncbi:hypothetical protein G9A89_004202 [Geosiphon pyriformis]|nr:hypothetical protein G9A89_004202 [Geosiphon pyriformis]